MAKKKGRPKGSKRPGSRPDMQTKQTEAPKGSPAQPITELVDEVLAFMDQLRFVNPPPAPMLYKAELFLKVPAISAVYFIWTKGVDGWWRVSYVGSSLNLAKRGWHRHHAFTEADAISWLPVAAADRLFEECLYIGALKPVRNKVRPERTSEGAALDGQEAF